MISDSDLEFLREAETCWRKMRQATPVADVLRREHLEHEARTNFKNSVAVHLKVNPRLAAYLWMITQGCQDHDIQQYVNTYSFSSRFTLQVEKDCSRVLVKEPHMQHNREVLVQFLNHHRYRSVTAKRLVLLKLALL